MKLNQSYVCVSCEAIFSRAVSGGCPECQSYQFYPLSKWIRSMTCKGPQPEPVVNTVCRRIGWDGEIENVLTL